MKYELCGKLCLKCFAEVGLEDNCCDNKFKRIYKVREDGNETKMQDM